MFKRVVRDQLEGLRRGHARRELEPWRARPGPVGPCQCAADIGPRASVQAAIYEIAHPARLREQLVYSTSEQFELDLVNAFTFSPGANGPFIRRDVDLRA